MDDFRQGRLLRIFVDEKDRRGMQPLYTAIVEFLRSRHIAGATVFRGVEGYGSHNEIHAARVLSWVPNRPILIEVVDDAGPLEAILPELQEIVGEGLITLEAADYLQLRRTKTQPMEEAMLMRIFVDEADRWEKRPLFEALVDVLFTNGIAGATVLKGIEGYGARRELHAARSIDFSSNLPIVIEVAETSEKIRSLLPQLRGMIAEGLITLEKIRFAHR